MSTPASRSPEEILLAFTRALRAAGVPVTADRSQSFLAAVALLGADKPEGVYRAGRATLCSTPDDLQRFDQVFDAYFNARDGLPRPRPSAEREQVSSFPADDSRDSSDGSDPDELIRAAASGAEVLRHRDVASLTAAEKQRLAAMFSTLRPRPPLRRTYRHQSWHRGDIDSGRTLRSSMRRMGEPGDLAWRRRGCGRQPRRPPS